MKSENEFIPFGEEWKDELMKLPKIAIISMYRNTCLELEELQKAYQDACDAAGANEQRAREAESEIRQILNDIER